MNRDPIFKHVVLAFVFALGIYLLAFFGIERSRHVKGPWRITFQSDDQGRPSLTISQPQLQISAVKLVLHGERVLQTNLAETVVFDGPKTNVPFGRIIFFDTTFLPGTITLDLFGHEIELVPRVLGLNRSEVPWQPDRTIELREGDKAPVRPDPRKRRQAAR